MWSCHVTCCQTACPLYGPLGAAFIGIIKCRTELFLIYLCISHTQTHILQCHVSLLMLHLTHQDWDKTGDRPAVLESLVTRFIDTYASLGLSGVKLLWPNYAICIYGVRDLGQHWFMFWLVAWRHQAITRTNADFSLIRSSDIHLRAISEEIPQPPNTKTSLKINYQIFDQLSLCLSRSIYISQNCCKSFGQWQYDFPMKALLSLANIFATMSCRCSDTRPEH